MADPMNGRWADLDQGPVASAQMIQWHAPKTWAAVRDTVIAEIAARGWEHADRGSLALVLDKVREAGFADGLHAAREVDRLGYVVVRHSQPGTFPYPEYSLADGSLWDDRKLAEADLADVQAQADADGDERRYFIGEVHEADEAVT